MIREIFDAIRRNKLRTALTGFAVAWGIFMLIVLLGAGNGLINAFEESSSKRALNSIRVFPGWTSMPCDGLEGGLRVRLKNGDMELTKLNFPDNVLEVGASLSPGTFTVSNGNEYVSASVNGYYPNHTEIEDIEMLRGRFINNIDIERRRKVLVLGSRAEEILFRGQGLGASIGRFVRVGNVVYKVVGVSKSDSQSGQHSVAVPFSTLQIIHNMGDEMHAYSFTTSGLTSIEANEAFETELRKVLGAAHRFRPDDMGAIWLWNRMTQYLTTQTAMNALTVAIWVIGIFTLLSGVVGVSNIMLITVKERTREFGIRKALGAKPRSILALVMAESIVITTLFGYVGMVAGIGVTELANSMLGSSTIDNGAWSETVFTNPTVDLSVAIEATLTLVAAGTIAGFIPARKAVKVKPIEALNAD